MCITVSKRHSK